MTRANFISAICAAIFAMFFVNANADQYKTMYVIDDIAVLDGDLILHRGKLVNCELSEKEGKCCLQFHDGEECVPISKFSESPIEKIDLSLKDVRYLDSKEKFNNVCKKGKSIDLEADTFKWTYGFSVYSKENSNIPVMVQITHSIKFHSGILTYPILYKSWKGKSDGKCHEITIYKNDIDKFLLQKSDLNDYAKFYDLNIPVKVEIKLISALPENNYKNNKVVFDSILPADNSSNWPN